MAEVKNVALTPASLPNGRLLRPGKTADVELADPEIRHLVGSGQLATLDEDAPNGDTVSQILGWVGDDSQRAATALAAEQARPEPRSTLVAKLEHIVNTHQEDSA